MDKKKEESEIFDNLGYKPSKDFKNIKISKKEVKSTELELDPEYQQYLKLKEKFAPLEKKKKYHNPIISIILKILLSLILLFIILFTIGFIMGMNGYKPQQFDWNVVTNQLNNNSNNSSYNELEKVQSLDNSEKEK